MQPRIVIVGIGGVFPGAANLEQFWANIAAGVDASSDVSEGRWLLSPKDAFANGIAVPDKVYSLRGYYLHEIPLDDAGIQLDRELFSRLDPLFRLILSAGNQAWRDAATGNLCRQRVGVILGNIALPTEKASALALEILGHTFAEKLGVFDEHASTTDPLNRYVTALPAGLLAKSLRLGGGSFTLDAACASSLFALKLAADELRAGRADAMLAGGAARPDCLYTQMGFSQLRALSPSGRCAPFDAGADGLVVGEGCGIVVLKRLDEALRDGDHIYALLAGEGISNDVEGNILAPASEGQLRAMKQAYRQAGWRPSDVDLIECHATGTPVGDSVELASLNALWSEESYSPGQCVLGSVKSSVGHLLTGAGAAGLIKVLLALQHETLPPTANFEQPAQALARAKPFRVLTESKPWSKRTAEVPRRAAISGFGFGGTNAHVLLEEHLPLVAAKVERIVVPAVPRKSEAVAIVGVGAHFGPWSSLQTLRDRFLGREEDAIPITNRKWWGVEDSGWFRNSGLTQEAFRGFFIDELLVSLEQFRIPPKELEEMLPQQLLMLQVATAALADCRNWEQYRLRTGVFLGQNLDLNTTNYHMRWAAQKTAHKWVQSSRLDLNEDEFEAWLSALRDAAHPALNANRVMGGLASIAASRIARVFHFGGPSFTLAGEEISGGRAIEAAMRTLQRGEIDLAVAGAVDLAGDVRDMLCRRACQGATANASLIGEGAAAVVLKRLADAERDGDDIYAVIRGAGSASGDANANESEDEAAQRSALERAWADAQLSPHEMDFVENCNDDPTQLHSATAAVGHAGAASFLASLIKSVLTLGEPNSANARTPRRASVSGTSIDGNYIHLILDEAAAGRSHRQFSLPYAKAERTGKMLSIRVGGEPFQLPPPPKSECSESATEWIERARTPIFDADLPLFTGLVAVQNATAEAHARYLRFAEAETRHLGNAMAFTQQLLAVATRESDASVTIDVAIVPSQPALRRVLDTTMCKEFADGSIARVLGPEYAEVDRHPTRVRLPSGPLMLVDRITTIEGEPRSLQSGRVVTEHSVHSQRWYLAEGIIPPCIAIEAGQADLFLSAYLGIDFISHGLAVYRLLDASVTFHRELPMAGETIQYDIHIDHFFRQGETHLFRFRFEGTIGGEPLLTMQNGCAGFFTAEELAAGKGIVQTEIDKRPIAGKRPNDWHDLAPMHGAESYDERQLQALRAGDLVACFGGDFAQLPLRNPLTLPDGMLKLVDRVIELDPHGGRFGLGRIRAEMDIDPDAWFLTCHFCDDQVMPGTLMYECCLHTLRILLLRMGWIGEKGKVSWQPVPGVASKLKCRGQVIASTKTVLFEVSLKEIGYRPEPFALADVLMYADGKPIVEIQNMSLRLVGTDREQLQRMWNSPLSLRGRGAGVSGLDSLSLTSVPSRPREEGRELSLFAHDRILAFATGKPSEAFGERYRIFDHDRFIARLPAPPYNFLHRIVSVRNCKPWRLAAGGEVRAEYDVAPSDWYFEAARQQAMPFAVLLEVALQPCGWFAAYLGAALTSPEDLCFRNLGGKATQWEIVRPEMATLRTDLKLTNVSQSAGMTILSYDFWVRCGEREIYSGSTYFGFFQRPTLAQQVGIREAKPFAITPEQLPRGRAFPMPCSVLFPDDRWRMIDRIDPYIPDEGSAGLGFIRGSKQVNPKEWFFHAHFLHDPVWPGSLGLEAFLQLLQVAATERWPECGVALHHLGLGRPHSWTYRGQVIPANREVTVEADIKNVDDEQRIIGADGYLSVDERIIYEMKGFTLQA
ncbi:MAG TPA: beta-ketoacyl synthase N-terminal-like domain-containing protein [Gemmataceae bacterium]|nr:beta-ketoacyl synthase N-terminal-like domain-containing protein [Gemmataceae bacterium]